MTRRTLLSNPVGKAQSTPCSSKLWAQSPPPHSLWASWLRCFFHGQQPPHSAPLILALYPPQSFSHTSHHAGHSDAADHHTMPGIAVTYPDNFLALLNARPSNTAPNCPGPALNSTGNIPHANEFYVPAKSIRPGQKKDS